MLRDVTRVGSWPSPVLGLVRRRQKKARALSLLSSVSLSFFPSVLRSFRSFHF